MDQPNATNEMKACRVCAESIKKSALICTHCNSYQDWRRNLSFSGTVLSLLVALFSVLTVSLPVISELITPKNSYIVATYQGVHNNVITALVSNTGNRAGTIHDAIIYIELSKTVTTMPLDIEGASDGGALIVEPGKTLLVNFIANKPPTAALTMLKEEMRSAIYILRPAVTNFDGKSGSTSTQIPLFFAWGIVGPFLPK